MDNTTDPNSSFLFTETVDLYVPPESEVQKARIILLLPRFIFIVTILVVGSVGNVLVLYVYHFKFPLSTFTLFIQVLAGLDLLNCFTSVPGAIALIIGGQDQINIHVLCSVMPFLSLYTAIASGALFVIIAYQRYQGICKPLDVPFDLPVAKKLCLGSILLALLPSVIRLFLDYGLRSEVTFNNITFNITMCIVTELERTKPLYLFYQAVLFILFFGIFLFLSVMYILMWREMFKNAEKRSELFQNQTSCNQHTNSHKYSTFKIFFAITVVFILSYLPHLVIVTFRHLSENLTQVRRAFYDLGYYSPLWNNAANPLVYSFFAADFRTKCKEVLCCAKETSEAGRYQSRRNQSRIGSNRQTHV